MEGPNPKDYEHVGMDATARRYLKKVLNTIFVGLFWLIAMMFFGIFLAAAFPVDGHFDAINIAFYTAFLLSGAWLVRFYYRTWRS